MPHLNNSPKKKKKQTPQIIAHMRGDGERLTPIMGGERLTPIMITASQAAALFGVPEGTLANLRSRGEGARYYKIGRKILYRLSDCETWVTGNPVQTIDSM